jgi:hypothetical protein
LTVKNRDQHRLSDVFGDLILIAVAIRCGWGRDFDVFGIWWKEDEDEVQLGCRTAESATFLFLRSQSVLEQRKRKILDWQLDTLSFASTMDPS